MPSGVTDSTGTVVFTGVSAGQHTITANKQPYNTGTITVTVSGNQTFTISLTPISGQTYIVTVIVRDQNTGAVLPQATVDLN